MCSLNGWNELKTITFQPFQQGMNHHKKRLSPSEAQVLEILKQHPHPNIVRVLSIKGQRSFNSSGTALFERHETDLFNVVANKTYWSNTHNLFLQVLYGLQHLHHLGVIHCDVKLENILISSTGISKPTSLPKPTGLIKPHVKPSISTSRRVLLCDFGMSHITDTYFQLEKGTLNDKLAWPPEMIMKNCVLNDKTDVYSFGLLILSILTKSSMYSLRMHDFTNKIICRAFHDQSYNTSERAKLWPEGFVYWYELAMICIKSAQKDRPSISRLIDYLKDKNEIPGLLTHSKDAIDQTDAASKTNKANKTNKVNSTSETIDASVVSEAST